MCECLINTKEPSGQPASGLPAAGPGWGGVMYVSTGLGRARRRKARIVAGLAAAAALVLGLTVAAVPASASGSGTGRYYHLLAGNGEYLVYDTCRTLHCGPGSDDTLHVRDVHGNIRTLPDRLTGLPYLTDHLFISVKGGFYHDDYPVRVSWWDLKTHRHGVRTVPGTTTQVVGAIPGGWLYVYRSDRDTARTLFRQGTGGKTSVYAKLPPFSVFDAVTGTQGVITGRNGDPLQYRRYDSSTTRTLDVPAHKYESNSCFALTHGFAGCRSDHYDADGANNIASQFSLTPLSGGPTVLREVRFADVGLADAQQNGVVIFARPEGPNYPSRLVKIYPDGSMRVGLGHHANSMIVAYGKIIVGHGRFARPGLRERVTWQTGVRTKQHILLG